MKNENHANKMAKICDDLLTYKTNYNNNNNSVNNIINCNKYNKSKLNCMNNSKYNNNISNHKNKTNYNNNNNNHYINTSLNKCQKHQSLHTFLGLTQCSSQYINTAAILLITLNLLISLSPCDAFLLDGSQNSFAQFRKWYTGLNGSLEFEFKTEQPNGLVLYTDDGGTFDFFEIKLVEGAVRLRYNLGGGANIITVGRELHDGHWHKVQVRKKTNRKDYADAFIHFAIFLCISACSMGNNYRLLWPI